MQNHQFPPPPPPAPNTAPQFAAPPQAWQQPAPQQGFAPPAAAVPQGFSQPQAYVPSVDLNAVNADGLNLLPQVAVGARLRVMGYTKGVRTKAGPCYTVTLQPQTSNAAELPVGATFHQIFKMSMNPTQQGGDRSRKAFLAGVFGHNPNAQVDWNALDAQMQAYDFQATPVYVELQQHPDYSRPMLDKTTRQPLPGQFWCRQNWSRPQS
jgi:hypothetical protein